MSRLYASLTGPLLGLYLPLPTEIDTPTKARLALASSKLCKLWCAIYDEPTVDKQIQHHGGQKLPERHAMMLDYDSFSVHGPSA